MAVLAALGFLGLIAAFVAFIVIWSINTLFGLSIDYSLQNWFAAWLLVMIFHGGSG